MKTLMISLVVCCGALMAVTPSAKVFASNSGTAVARPTPPKNDLLDKVAALQDELKGVSDEQGALAEEAKKLNEEEKRYSATADLLRGATANYKKEFDVFRPQDQTNKNEIAAHNAAQCTYRDSPSECDWYKQRASRLNTERAQLDDRRATLQMRYDGLVARRKDLSDAVVDWARRKKENNYKATQLQGRAADLFSRITAALRELHVREATSNECAKLAAAPAVDENGLPILEPASQCLQAVWDGAKSHKQLPAVKRRGKNTQVRPNN